MAFRLLMAPLLLGSLAACSTLPAGAPTDREFARLGEHPRRQPEAALKLAYHIIDLDPKAALTLATYKSPGFSAVLDRSDYRPSLKILPGDLVSITIFDVSAEPLLGASGVGNTSVGSISAISGHSTSIPTQVVEFDGAVKIPYAGSVKIAGMVPSAADRAIELSLKGQMKAPQVIVSLVSSALDTVTVAGGVDHPGIIPLTVRGERILDVVAAAGGAKYELYDCDIQLVRRNRTYKERLQNIVDHSEENVVMEPGDSLYILRNPQSFSVLGSTMKVSQINFDSEKVNLAEAVARSGGPTDALASIQNIYLLRYESKAVVQSLEPSYLIHQDDGSLGVAEKLPVAYHLDLGQGSGYFIAQAIQIRDKDVILVTKADAAQLQEVFQLIRSVTGIYFDVKPAAVHQ